MILLDTQALIWLVEHDPRLGPEAIRIEAESESVAISAITLWELGLLVSRGRLRLSMALEPWVRAVTAHERTSVIAVTQEIALDAGLLPTPIHGDPGDRIIIATARSLGYPLLTSDRKILDYAAAGHVRAVDAAH